jgi:hypothetical protein
MAGTLCCKGAYIFSPCWKSSREAASTSSRNNLDCACVTIDYPYDTVGPTAAATSSAASPRVKVLLHVQKQ